MHLTAHHQETLARGQPARGRLPAAKGNVGSKVIFRKHIMKGHDFERAHRSGGYD